ncbi:lengsin-like [Amphiura filiformis]|uniref:lengsin-like n=1 Tax=Amphiura filiformis TaxID=82378 RepID=UPI003B2102DA
MGNLLFNYENTDTEKEHSKDEKERIGNIMSRMKADDVKFVRFELSDIYGVARSKIVPVKHFESKATRGTEFSFSYMAWDPSGNFISDAEFAAARGGCAPDVLTFPDMDTYTTIPWRENTGRILIEPTLKGKPVAAHPRTVARQQLDSLKELGYALYSAYEHEFSVVNKDTLEPYTQGNNCRSTLRNDKDPDLTRQLMTDLPKVGVDIEVFESEWGAGQIEIVNKPSFGIQAADTSHTCRISVKEIAIEHGYIASFMTKPWPENDSRTALHFNHSLWDIKGENSMMTDNNSNGLSIVAQHWIAGVLAHVPAIAVLMAPTVNCLKTYHIKWYHCSHVS